MQSLIVGRISGDAVEAREKPAIGSSHLSSEHLNPGNSDHGVDMFKDGILTGVVVQGQLCGGEVLAWRNQVDSSMEAGLLKRWAHLVRRDTDEFTSVGAPDEYSNADERQKTPGGKPPNATWRLR